jgi:SAM-dependent methyltransferase
MAQAIIQPSRMRRAFNGWCKGLFAGQQFKHVLNLGCGHNVDRQGMTYDGYWMAERTTLVDISANTEYPEHEAVLCGGRRFVNPDHVHCSAEDLTSIWIKPGFDMVFCNWVIYHCDHEKVLKEICSVLMPKGKLYLSWMSEVEDDTIWTAVKDYFIPIAWSVLWCDPQLDGREGEAMGFWGEKK